MRHARKVAGILALASTVTLAAGCSSGSQRYPVWGPSASWGVGEGRTKVKAAKPSKNNRGNRGQRGQGQGQGKKKNGNGQGQGNGKGRGNP